MHTLPTRLILSASKNLPTSLDTALGFLSRSVLALAISSTFMATVTAEELPDTYVPAGGYHSTTDAKYIEPSATQAIVLGQKISSLTKRNFDGETILQKLTENSFWVQTGFYNTVFYVGKHGVLLMDPLGHGKGKTVLKAIKSITNKPVSAVIYSHHHEDHIGNAQHFIDDAKLQGVTTQIIATQATFDGMKINGSTLPLPTVVLNTAEDKHRFEDITISVHTLSPAAHTYDSAVWLLREEKIAHIPDVVNPDQMPFLGFGNSDTFSGYEDNLLAIQALPWEHFSGGHGNIGSKADFKFMLTYIDDLKKAAKEASKRLKFSSYLTPKYNNHQASAKDYYKDYVKEAMNILRDRYGNYYGFEASVPYQIMMVRDSWND